MWNNYNDLSVTDNEIHSTAQSITAVAVSLLSVAFSVSNTGKKTFWSMLSKR